MKGTLLQIPDVPYLNLSSVVNKKYVDNIESELMVKINKVTVYRDLHFTGLGRSTVWGQIPTKGFPFLPLEVSNVGSKSVITILSISANKDNRNNRKSGLLDSTIKISLKYYTDDGTTKGSGEVVVGTFKMSDFRYHEITDGSETSVVYPVNIKYVISHGISDYSDIKYVTLGIAQTVGVVEGNEVNMSLRYDDFE